MKPAWPLIDAARLGNTLESLKASIVPGLQRALVDLRAMMSNGLTFTDNMNAAIVTLGRTPGGSQDVLTHGVEYALANPLKNGARPIGFLPMFGTDANGIALDVDTDCKLNLLRTDGLLGLTVRFASPFGILRLSKTANQNGIADSTAVVVTWDNHLSYSGGDLTHSTTTLNNRIQCAKDGFVHISFTLAWSGLAPVIGNNVGGWVSKNGSITGGSNRRFGKVRAQANGAQDVITGSSIVGVAAGDFLAVYAIQANSTVTALNLLGNSTVECSVQAHYVSPAAAQTGTVTGILVGA